jgi:hypothetical protein
VSVEFVGALGVIAVALARELGTYLEVRARRRGELRTRAEDGPQTDSDYHAP